MNAYATIAVLDHAHCWATKIFCDGYISKLGKSLQKHCANRAMANKLMALADEHNRKQGDEKGKQKLDLFIKPSTGYDDFIIRKLSDVSNGNYVYLFDTERGRWLVGVENEFSPEEKTLYPKASAGVFYSLKSMTGIDGAGAMKGESVNG